MLQRYLQYNLWANERLIDNIQSVPTDAISTLPLAPFGSIHNALRHIVGAESIWLERLRGQRPSNFMSSTENKTLQELLGMLVTTSNEWVQHFAENPEALTGTFTYTTTKGDPFTHLAQDVVTHVVNHSTYHRGQIMSALRSVYEGRLAGLDMIVFART